MKLDELDNYLPPEILELLNTEDERNAVATALNQARVELNNNHNSSFAGDMMRSVREVFEVAKKFIKTQKDLLRLLQSLPGILEMLPSKLVESETIGDYLVLEVDELRKAAESTSSLDDFLSLYRDPDGNGPYLSHKPGRMDYN